MSVLVGLVAKMCLKVLVFHCHIYFAIAELERKWFTPQSLKNAWKNVSLAGLLLRIVHAASHGADYIQELY